VKLDTALTLKKDDKVPGSGILTPHFSDGATFPLKDAVRLMIVFSDNTATNMILDQIGIPATNERMAELGFKNTKINAKVFKGSTTSIDPEGTKKYGLGSTTAKEMVGLLELIEAGKVVSPVACKEMLVHLKACDDKEKMTRLLPAGTVVAHKTGSVNASKTDAGIIYLKSGPVAVCVLTDENDDKRWVIDNAAQVLIAKIAKEVYDHFGEAEKPKK
jgi:beta-lactamase class A